MKHLFYTAIALILFSCNSENNSLVITFNSANGLEKGSPVILNDLKIGAVQKISLSTEYKINAEIILLDTIRLPKDSKFTIGSQDMFTTAIIIDPGESKSYLTKSDKIYGDNGRSLNLDSLLNIITHQIDNSKPVKNQDSIITELKKLNKELEEINKE